MQTHPLSDSPADIEPLIQQVVAVLRAGGVIAAPTETVYGLMTLWSNAAGRERLYALKQRDERKPFQMLAADLPMAQAAGVLPDPRLERLVAQFCPGPLTLVCRAADGGTIGLRMPQHSFCLRLLRVLGEPLAATSANRSGAPAAVSAAAAVAELDGQPDLLIDGGTIADGAASTVVSLVDAELQILRAGPVSLDQLQAALRAAP